MRVAVANRYWATMGGGEQFAGGIAQALAERHATTVLTPEPFDAARLRDRLAVDLTRVPQRPLGPEESAVTQASADFDLLVNCTFLSDAANLARRGLYVVHFPAGRRGRRVRAHDAVATWALERGRAVRARWGRGFAPPEPDGVRYSDGVGTISLWLPGEARVTALLVAPRWADGRATDVEVTVDRRVVFKGALAPGDRVPVEVDVVPTDRRRPVLVVVRGTAVNLIDELGWPMPRTVGPGVVGLTVDGLTVPDGHVAHRLTPTDPWSFLETYDRIAANSVFTQHWIERLWGRASDVLYPPVLPRTAGTKQRLIVSVGRFFDVESGHSKKQLELVHAFRRLVDGGVTGWRLALVGGCAPESRDYAMAVKRAALGLPVDVHLNAPGAVLTDLLARASIFWHAGGLGEDASRYPDRMEHFGIAVVEAMSARAVPVVYGVAGPAETVEDGRSGLHFHDLDGLVAATRRLIDDQGLLARLADGAADRARTFAYDEFTVRLHRMVEEVMA